MSTLNEIRRSNITSGEHNALKEEILSCNLLVSNIGALFKNSSEQHYKEITENRPENASLITCPIEKAAYCLLGQSKGINDFKECSEVKGYILDSAAASFMEELVEYLKNNPRNTSGNLKYLEVNTLWEELVDWTLSMLANGMTVLFIICLFVVTVLCFEKTVSFCYSILFYIYQALFASRSKQNVE
jgi:hypothetical protein